VPPFISFNLTLISVTEKQSPNEDTWDASSKLYLGGAWKMSDYDYWESAYQSGDFGHWEFDYPSPELVAVVASNIIKDRGRVLDVGCGGGQDAILLAKYGFDVIGVDISYTALKIARKRGQQAHVSIDWCRTDVLQLPIENQCVDFVNDRGVFHIIEETDRPRYASELFRVLRTGGNILIRGTSETRGGQFNPVTEEAIDKYFPTSRFRRGPVLPIPLLSVAGVMDANIVVLTKIVETASNNQKVGKEHVRRIREM
jgi:ubiquinone/menaquinone biosynthesis C-methylase UbiE